MSRSGLSEFWKNNLQLQVLILNSSQIFIQVSCAGNYAGTQISYPLRALLFSFPIHDPVFSFPIHKPVSCSRVHKSFHYV